MKKSKNKETVLVIPDIQCPFEHPDTIEFLKAVEEWCEPTKIIQIGDLIDSHAISDFASDPDGLSAGDELERTKKHLKKFYKAFPNVEVVVGNHDTRLYRLAYKTGIPRSCMRNLEDLLAFPKGWSLHEEVIYDNVTYEHGDKFGNGGGNNAFKKAIDANMMSTVYGHFHASAGIRYYANKKFLHFAMNVGCLMDTHSYAAAYGARFPSKPILGCGVVFEGTPMFIPMVLNNKGRWNGEI